MLKSLAEEGLALGPIRLEVESGSQPDGPYDGVLRASWPGQPIQRRFIFDCKTAWTRRVVERALEQLRNVRLEHPPLFVFPYLSDQALEDFQARTLSAIDLCGNGILIDPPHLFVLRTGAKRAFKALSRDYSVYLSRNVASLVSRVFLLQTRFPTTKAILDVCRARMMSVEGQPDPLVLSTVSKALAQLEQDLVVDRKGRQSVLRAPERLLAELFRSFRPAPHSEPFLGKTALSTTEVWTRLQALRPRVRAVATGRGSAAHHTGLAGPERLQLYISDLRIVRDALEARPTQAFPNLELLETAEEAVYFDARAHDGALWSSPIQTYLELAHGTPRELDAAGTLRARLLGEAAARTR
jgi:hypothetical protein